MELNLIYIASVLIIIFISMTIHEVTHGYVAHLLGDSTASDLGRLSLNPLRHIDPFLTIILPIVLAVSGLPVFGGAKPVPFNANQVRGGEWGVALVAIAGPLTNLALAFLTFAVLAVSDIDINSLGGQFLLVATMVNLGFFVFNIIPVPPLDGSRVLYAIAPDFVRQFMSMIERAGLIIIFLIVMVASPLIGPFISGAMNFILMVFSRMFGLS